MKKFLTLVCCFVITATQAQERHGNISGFIKDKADHAVEAATVQLLQPETKAVVKVAITDKAGKFEFVKLKEGNYVLRISAVGFAAFDSKPLSISNEKPLLEVGNIALEQSGKALAEVTVTTRKPLVENKIDKTVVNVESFISSAGSSAMDMLEKSPGVTVDKDGNISLKGKQGIIILIDGKQTYLGGQDLANFLRNMPANQLETIELMTQPSAKYDASGNSGIINFRLKKSKQAGFNGSINLGYVQGAYPKSPNSINFNYKKNKVNLFTNYSYSYWENFNRLFILRNFRDRNEQITSVFDQLSRNYSKSNNHNLRVGMDYSVDKKTTVGFVVSGSTSNRVNGANSESKILNGTSKLDSINSASTASRDPWRNFSANVNFRRVLDTTGREITADADYVWYGSQQRQTSDNYTTYPGHPEANSFLLKAFLPSDIKIYSMKVDYIHPFSKTFKMEAGLKTSYVTTDNDAQYKNRDDKNEDWKIDQRRSNHFIYDENINAAYVSFSKQLKKWGFQQGLRFEQTIGKGEQMTNHQKIDRKYEQLFPTTYVSYQADKKNNFGISYGRRIERPNYRDMNPFQYFLDQYTYEAGNPYLTPQFSHNIQVSHNYKGELNTTLNYTTTTDIINSVMKQNDSTKVTFVTKENIAERTNIGLAVSYNKSVKKWWTTSVFFNVFQNHFKGVVNNLPLDAKLIAFMVNSNNQLKFNKGWGAEVSGFYRSSMQEGGMMLSRPMGVVSFGFSKQVWKEKGTIRVSLRDPFYMQQFKGDIRFGQIDTKVRNKWDNRQVALNFTYRFGKPINGQPRRRSGSAQDEQNRAGGSGQQ